jgi:hypothetical protein
MNKKMNLLIVFKAYRVGTKHDISVGYYPDSSCQTILVQPHQDKGKAKSIYAKEQWVAGEGFLDLRARRDKSEDRYLFEGKHCTYKEILDIIALRDWKNKQQELVNENPDAQVNIFSKQWNLWWRCDGKGYTDSRESAGVYSAKDAWSRIAHCGLEKGNVLIKIQ